MKVVTKTSTRYVSDDRDSKKRPKLFKILRKAERKARGKKKYNGGELAAGL